MANTAAKSPRGGDFKFYLQDDENTFLYNPLTMYQNRFFGQVGKTATLTSQLNHERQQKYYLDYNAHAKAQSEITSIPICFDSCVAVVETGTGLTSDEKNCMRECTLKRMSSREDLAMLAQQ